MTHIACSVCRLMLLYGRSAGQGYIWMCHRDPASPLWRMAAAGKARWEELDAKGGAIGEAMEWQVGGSSSSGGSSTGSRVRPSSRHTLLYKSSGC
jgi:hypothetical protein